MIHLRGYQEDIKARVYDVWRHDPRANVLLALATGGGKTPIFAAVVREHSGASCVIAHRGELVGQISLTLARNGVRHRIIGPNDLVRAIVQSHIKELGVSWFDPTAPCAVASVKTIIRRGEQLRHWCAQVTLWVMDEAHHLCRHNEWGLAVAMFPNARGLGVTATPERADGHGLGRHASGVMDALVEGPPVRWLMDEGYLTDYDPYCPPTDIHMEDIKVSPVTGEMTPPTVKKAVRASHIVGDVLKHYQLRGLGKLGVIFGSDVETATDFAQRFQGAGVVAEVVHGGTKDELRLAIVERYRRGEVHVLSSVDLFSEGFDLPAIQIGHFARPTTSIAVHRQQIGRGLRPMYAAGFDLETRSGRLGAIAASIKPRFILCDHVGNLLNPYLGLPDQVRRWTLDSRERKARTDTDDAIPLKSCPMCTKPYERYRITCPYCGHEPTVSARGGAVEVDGDLVLMSAARRAELLREKDRIDDSVTGALQSAMRAGMPEHASGKLARAHVERQTAQTALRSAITWWAGIHKARGLQDREIQKMFYLRFGSDVLEAQSLGTDKATELTVAVEGAIQREQR